MHKTSAIPPKSWIHSTVAGMLSRRAVLDGCEYALLQKFFATARPYTLAFLRSQTPSVTHPCIPCSLKNSLGSQDASHVGDWVSRLLLQNFVNDSCKALNRLQVTPGNSEKADSSRKRDTMDTHRRNIVAFEVFLCLP